MTRRQAADQYKSVVAAALDEGIRVRCHLEDATRADFYGFVVPFVQELMAMAKEAKIPIKIRVCDTMGFGIPYPGAAMPRCVAGLIYGLIHFADVPSEWLEWHGHNDFFKVLVNAATAWLYGCCAANGTLLGIGERTGNPPIEALVVEYASIRGTTDGMDLTALTEIADYYEKEIGYHIPDNYPLLGKHCNVTAAGIHADGMSKHPEIYSAFDTVALMNRAPGVMITQSSGLAGIALWINMRNEKAGKDQISKSHPALKKIKKRIDAEYARGRVTAISDEEMEAYCRQFLPDVF
jgi:isopropylmalate/homocitrate/citramalate synthase